jgi:hypothetical protein
MENRTLQLLDKCEALSLLCSKATSHWSFIKFVFSVPLILTSSIMCILNSFERDGHNNMRIPNVVVNGISVLLMSLQSSMKVSEKVQSFKNISNNFLLLAHQIEGTEQTHLDNEKINAFVDKYDSLVQQTFFEDIPDKCKKQVMILFENRFLPIQLNGCSGIVIEKRKSPNFVTRDNINEEIV